MDFRKATKIVGVLAAAWLAAGPTAAPAQSLRLRDLPSTTGNTRFFRDVFAVRHPSLSLNGFTCDGLAPGGCADGLGLAEILRAVYAEAPDDAVKTIYEKLLLLAGLDLVRQPTSRSQVIENTQRIEARAFVALATYVLERSGNDLRTLNARTEPDLPPHTEALRRFKEGLFDEEVYSVRRSLDRDAVKWPIVLTNTARALDLYLALENAYRHYGDRDYGREDATRLLSCFEKGAWFSNVAFSMRALDDLAHEELVPYVRLSEVQPGNWPMKIQTALGYAALAMQQHEGRCYPAVRQEYPPWLYRALESAGAPTDQDRSKHWHYQTDGGRRFFAEGPYYFHLALAEILPFWHALRLNGLLNAHPDFDPGDPFRADWFTRPLHWLADLATPDGRLPPLDDGNKVDLRDAALMRWTAAYGDAALGRKMAWVADRQPRGWGVSRDLLLVEMAIPRLGAGAGEPPPSGLGNTAPEQAGEDGEQQLVLRREAATGLHYVLLNGEHGDAVRRGEGHEQGDQMQLLYYVDAVSYLLDSGYDDAVGVSNSTWNHYADHNVMTMGLDRGNREGGVKDPRPRLDKRRVVSNHQDVGALYRATTGRLDVLTAQIDLDPDDDLGRGVTAAYRRTVLFVHDPRHPYLIDLNAATGPADSLFHFVMRYHGNADAMTHTPDRDGFALWANLWASTDEPEKTAARLFLQPFSVEYPLKAATDDDRAQEGPGGKRAVVRLDLEGGPPGASLAQDHTTVAFVRALPDAAEVLPLPPVAARTHRDARLPDTAPLTWRFYTWQLDSATVDVLAVRSAAVHRRPDLRSDEALRVDTPAGPLTLDFPADADYGFARLRSDGAAWFADPDYRLHLSLRNAQPVAAEHADVPQHFRLEQNVPNPFRDTTEIRFALPEAAHVQLVVYDLNGREVARLVDGRRAAGVHRVTWRARGLASGVYLCRLTAGRFIETQRMVLRK